MEMIMDVGDVRIVINGGKVRFEAWQNYEECWAEVGEGLDPVATLRAMLRFVEANADAAIPGKE